MNAESLTIIVAGHLHVAPQDRTAYLAGCVGAVEQARGSEGCLDFSVTADLLDPGRIQVFERWTSRAALEAFRGSGPSAEQATSILDVSVAEYAVADRGALRGGGRGSGGRRPPAAPAPGTR